LIGGYTPLVWSKSTKIINDPSGRTFIFSLTNNDKFKLKKDMPAIYQAGTIGPTFGNGNPDFYITNNANTSPSYAQINKSYINDKYTQGDNESYNRFSGDRSYNYKVK
jgi:hypothetical protein